MSVENADGRYSYRAWDRRPGDGVDPSVMLDAAEVIYEVAAQAPTPPAAGYPIRLTGIARTQPGITDVLGVGPVPLMQDTETRQDSGSPGTLRPATGHW